jgi:chromosome segregation ATPase
MKENNSQVLRHELDDRDSIINELKTKHSNMANEMKEKFRTKLEQQNGLIDELKIELESAITRNQDFQQSHKNNDQEMKTLKEKLQEQTEERERLDNQLHSLNR